jgi:hypothetical protein
MMTGCELSGTVMVSRVCAAGVGHGCLPSGTTWRLSPDAEALDHTVATAATDNPATARLRDNI